MIQFDKNIFHMKLNLEVFLLNVFFNYWHYVHVLLGSVSVRTEGTTDGCDGAFHPHPFLVPHYDFRNGH